MTNLGGIDPAARRERVMVRPETLSSAPITPKGEVFEDGTSLVGTFYLPLHQPQDVKYHVGRRTITLWSRKQGHEFQTILVLPRWVDPETFILAHQNGVYEFVMQSGNQPPRPGSR